FFLIFYKSIFILLFSHHGDVTDALRPKAGGYYAKPQELLTYCHIGISRVGLNDIFNPCRLG
ncbi:hypothetical protein, partial [Citrobacter sp. Igbk 14]|uniref:hypothetical protein n=1 Tax=Citrobacter sp. Igbk 14 TaxID=2963960 RepID=UPI002303F7B6